MTDAVVGAREVELSLVRRWLVEAGASEYVTPPTGNDGRDMGPLDMGMDAVTPIPIDMEEVARLLVLVGCWWYVPPDAVMLLDPAGRPLPDPICLRRRARRLLNQT